MGILSLMVVSCSKKEDLDPPTDTNTPPTMQGRTFEVNEDISDTHIIGTMDANDSDNDLLEFSIGTDDDNLFDITTDGKLSLISGKSLDYSTKTSHAFTVEVSDGADNVSANVVVIVKAVNQSPQLEGQSFEVAENIGDMDVIGTVVAMDDDDLTFEIKQNDGYSINEPLFAISADGQLTLIEGVSLDYETAHEFGIIVTASDGENIVEAWMYITVTDVPEAHPDDKNAFVTTWETTTDNEEIAIGLFYEFSYDYQINWGDGNIETSTNENLDKTITHTYETAGTYTVSIVGTFPYINMQEETATPLSLQSIDQWGSIEWKTMAGAFKGCINMVYNATDIPDLSQVESMVSMFYGATSFNGDIGGWDLGNTVDNISGMFEGATSFNQDISGWDVSLVSFMGNLFNGASSFNQNLENWQVLSLKNSISFVGSGMSAQNYSSTIIGWAAQQVNQNVQVFASDINYCDDYDSIDAWNTLSNPNIFNWTVQHAGYVSCQ